ncbi:MAG TPA: response regulator transcription factor [Rhizomicrobium sp.]|jgi:two-component system invasion response regulator UvrY|nr:response regulator transcription factor [Rhizomicrobium sp.]
MKQVLVVEDHAIVRAGIRRLLDERGDTEVLEAATGEAALAAIASREFALVILDLNLPGLAGLELLRRIARQAPGVPVLVFSQHTEAIYATRALETGARGFVSKHASPEELLEAVETILNGGVAIEKDVAAEMAAHELSEDAYLRPLTERDLEILRLLSAGDSLSEIADKLGIAYKTVANTLSRIKEKLGVGQTSELIRIAVSRGLADRV